MTAWRKKTTFNVFCRVTKPTLFIHSVPNNLAGTVWGSFLIYRKRRLGEVLELFHQDGSLRRLHGVRQSQHIFQRRSCIKYPIPSSEKHIAGLKSEACRPLKQSAETLEPPRAGERFVKIFISNNAMLTFMRRRAAVWTLEALVVIKTCSSSSPCTIYCSKRCW